MRNEPSKAPLLLMEQMIMVLVFALAAGICIQAFALAEKKSRGIQQRDEAVCLAQTCGEIVKSSEGDITKTEKALKEAGFQVKVRGSKIQAGRDDSYLIHMNIQEETEKIGKAQVSVENRKEERLYGITVKWQEDSHE